MILFHYFLTFTVYQIELKGSEHQDSLVPKGYVTYGDPH